MVPLKSPAENDNEKQHKKAIQAWAMYDWANSAFVTSVSATILPIYFASVAARDLAPNIRTAYWGYTSTIAFLLVALLGPILGAMADFSGAKKRFLGIFVFIGITGTALLYLITSGDWLIASLFFIIGTIGFSGSIVFYDSLLPHVARKDEIDQVSSRGFAMGYLGGGIMLAANLGMIMFLPGILAKAPEVPQERLQQGKIWLSQAELQTVVNMDPEFLVEATSLSADEWRAVTRLNPETMSLGEGLTQQEWMEITGENEQRWKELSQNHDYAAITSLSPQRWSTIQHISQRELPKIELQVMPADWQALMREMDSSRLTGIITRICFVMVAVWWLLFTIPLWRHVPEPQRRILAEEKGYNPLKASFERLRGTFGELRKYKELAKFVVAFWLYYNGIGTIITMASIYGAELQFSQTLIIGTLLMVQFVAIPFSFLFGWLPKKMGTKPAIMLTLAIYTLIAIGGYFLRTEAHFLMLGFAVAMVQGGSQALSRSLFGRMVPRSKSAEFYSFFSISEKVAGTVGPLVFGVVSQIMGGSRLSIVSLVIFFALGGLLLFKVKEKEGIRIAEEDEASLTANAANA